MGGGCARCEPRLGSPVGAACDLCLWTWALLRWRMGEPSPGAELTVTAYLRGPQPVPGRLSREEYAATHGSAAEDVEAVRRFASAHGLTVGEVDRGRRSVELVGKIPAMQDAFGTRLEIGRASC